MDHKVIILLVVGLAHYSLADSLTGCQGCPVDLDVDIPKSQEVLTNTLSLLKTHPKGTAQEYTKLVKLNKATLSVVNGNIYKYDFLAEGEETHQMYNCHVAIWDQSYKGVLQITEYTCQPTANRNKRSVLGGEEEININEKKEELSKYRKLVSDELNQKQKSQYLMGVIKVLKATRQVVSGFLTKLEVEVAETDCLVGSTSSQEKCSFQEKSHQVCFVEVWEQPWLQKKEVTILECKNNQLVEAVAISQPRKPYFCAGCPVEKNSDDEVANQCLKRTLFNLNSKAHSTKIWKLVQVNKVKSQVVAGIKYTIEFEAEDEANVTYLCNTVIVLQPWITEEPTIVDFECTPFAE